MNYTDAKQVVASTNIFDSPHYQPELICFPQIKYLLITWDIMPMSFSLEKINFFRVSQDVEAW